MKFDKAMYSLYQRNSIERRFVAHARLRHELLTSPKSELVAKVEQGYISSSPKKGIFLSKIIKPREKPLYSLTIRDPEDPLYWIEQFVDSAQVFEALFEQTNGKSVSMSHYYHAEPSTCMTFDDFEGALNNLCLVRFNFVSQNQAQAFTPPIIMQNELIEVTENPSYSPVNLMCRPGQIDHWLMVNPEGNQPYDLTSLVPKMSESRV